MQHMGAHRHPRTVQAAEDLSFRLTANLAAIHALARTLDEEEGGRLDILTEKDWAISRTDAMERLLHQAVQDASALSMLLGGGSSIESPQSAA